MNVLVIPEDFRKDQFVLKPVVEAILGAAGKPRATVRACMDPLLGGVEQAMNWNRLDEIIERYAGMVQVLLLVVDRDGIDTRRAALNQLEFKASQKIGAGRFYAENAWQEVEVWAMAGLDLPNGWSWAQIRSHPHPKEAYFQPLAEQRGVQEEPGEGRKAFATESAANYARVRARCREDVAALEERLSQRFAAAE